MTLDLVTTGEEMLPKVLEALARVPECSGWTPEVGFAPLDRFQQQRPRHFVLVRPPIKGFHGGVLFLAADAKQGLDHMVKLLLGGRERVAEFQRIN